MRDKIKVIRIIARLNIGGPAIHVALLTKGLDPSKFQSTLITGRVSSQEGDMSYIADALDERLIMIPDLQRELNFIKDMKSLLGVLRILENEKPDIVHTHTAKAGSIGRIAVFVHNLLHGRRVRVLHTFHGHVFRGYFGGLKSKFFILAERLLAKITDVIIVISKGQMDELSGKYRIAPSRKFRIVALGFDLEPFFLADRLKGHFRKSLGISNDTILVGIVGRLVPIKNHNMFLESARVFLDHNPNVTARFLIVGDGELKKDLLASCERQGLSDYVTFCGWKRNLPEVYADLDILCLTSLNEGTPVSIIEAMASFVPVIATDAGGVRDLLGEPIHGMSLDGMQVLEHGILCRQGDVTGFARGLEYVIQNRHAWGGISHSARSFVAGVHAKERLFHDMEHVYLELMGYDREKVSVLEAEDLVEVEQPALKVLQVYKDYYPPVIGGIEKHLNELCHGLAEKGVQSEVLVSNVRPRTEIVYDNSIRITKVPEHGRLQSAPLTASFYHYLRERAREADILHFHFPNPTAEMSLMFSKIDKPYVVTYHSDIIRQAKLRKLYFPFMLRFLRKAKAIIATSPNYVQFSDVLSKVQDKCAVVPFGVDPARFAPRAEGAGDIASVRKAYGPSIVLFIGKFRYYKGLDVLIEAMKKVKGKLLLIGAGPLEQELKKQAAAADLHKKVFFMGELSDQEVVTYLQACDVFVLPSTYPSEAFGIVQLEAMACGKPVVSTELGTGTSFVNQHQKTGLVIQPNDPGALAEAIDHLLASPGIREQYGRAGRKRVEQYFTRDGMIENVIETYLK